MGDHVSWQVELSVKPGQLESFRELTEEMIAAARDEGGVLIYERFINEDNHVVIVYERYADSAAAVAHLRSFAGDFGRRFSSMVERKKFSVFGKPSNELRTILNGFNATYFAQFAAGVSFS